MQGRKVWDNGPQEVWMKPLADGSRAVILFNRGTEAGAHHGQLGGHRLCPRPARPRSATSGRTPTSARSRASIARASILTAS